jgi:hypothetical protein
VSPQASYQRALITLHPRCGMPVVTTPIGAEGMGGEPWGGVVAWDEEELISGAEQLYTDKVSPRWKELYGCERMHRLSCCSACLCGLAIPTQPQVKSQHPLLPSVAGTMGVPSRGGVSPAAGAVQRRGQRGEAGGLC